MGSTPSNPKWGGGQFRSSSPTLMGGKTFKIVPGLFLDQQPSGHGGISMSGFRSGEKVRLTGLGGREGQVVEGPLPMPD